MPKHNAGCMLKVTVKVHPVKKINITKYPSSVFELSGNLKKRKFGQIKVELS